MPEARVTLAHWLRWATARLADSESARLDAELLLAEALAVSRAYLHTWPERTLAKPQARRYQELIEKRAAGEPIAYILGRQAFWSLDLEVTADTLIPRPETELLVEFALSAVPGDRDVAIADLGTGSGAIALALAKERPDATVTGVDSSADALAVAQRNRTRLTLDNVRFAHGIWYAPLAGMRFDLIVANPPYVGAEEPELARGDVRFEPRAALVAEQAGLADLYTIIDGAPAHLRPGGVLALEHGYRQADAVRAHLARNGFSDIGSLRDLQGHERITHGRLESAPNAEPTS